MTEWIELPDLQAVAIAQSKDWEIQYFTGRCDDAEGWYKWDGKYWGDLRQYRGRPRQPKMTTVKMQCWLYGNELHWLNEKLAAPLHWIRVPAEDKTIEIPEGV